MAELTIPVLVVDDYEPWRRFCSAALQQQPKLQVVGEGSDGLEAIRKAQEQQPDLISRTSEIDGLLSPGKADITRVLRGR